jgi:hypothetical protein
MKGTGLMLMIPSTSWIAARAANGHHGSLIGRQPV